MPYPQLQLSWPRNGLSTGIVLGLATGVLLLAYAVKCYSAWLSLGPGGMPYNVFGWLLNVMGHLFARRDVRTPAPYKQAEVEAQCGATWARKSTLDPSSLPTRSGSRPDFAGTVAPQRQVSDKATPEMLQRMKDFFAALAAANSHVVQLKLSGLEGPYQKALWLADGVEVPEFLSKMTKGEFAHPHGEGSTHVVLGPGDAARVIELGWGERHPLSGVMSLLPWGYVLIYASRNDDEFAVWKKFVLAAARYVAPDGTKVRMPR